MESVARGGTRWKRFAVVMVPSVAATAAIGVALSQGALAASFSVSGQQFKVTAKQLDGTGFVQYGAMDSGKSGNHPVAVVGMDSAKITNLCQSVVVPVPVFGDISMVLKAGGKGSPRVEARKLYIDADDLRANATFTNVDIGVSVDRTTKGPGPAKGDKYVPDSFAQQADKVRFTDVKQRAWATTAGTFKLSGLGMSVKKGKHECY
ncbi:cholesterol esterase [Streptomyces aureoverticillatus]|nr:cholesterol esterase [Streptomyces aureoverticillatus]